MEGFSFNSGDDCSSSARPSKFSGKKFYNAYKDSEFLHNKQNLDYILANSFELKHEMEQLPPGATKKINKFIIKGEPLILKKPGNGVFVNELDFTFYRLCGLVAAYVFENRHRYPVIFSSEAIGLGLKWDKTNEKQCRLYLSAVSGSQDFYDQFLFYPMICALRKLHLKKIGPKSVAITGNIKNDDGKTLKELFTKNNDEVVSLWALFPTASNKELSKIANETCSFKSGEDDSASAQPSKFSGIQFYNAYKDSEFLRNKQNIDNILGNSFKLKNKLSQLTPGATIELKGFMIRGKLLILKNPGKNAVVGELEFTYYRLCGLVAAYVFENRDQFPEINSSEANALGLTWDNTDDEKCRMYLSAVSGSQDHYDQFLFWPLICCLRKLHLQKTKPQSVLINAKIKNANGKTMAELFKENYEKVECLWTLFSNATLLELKVMSDMLPV